MSTAEANRLIIVSLLVGGGLAVVKEAAHGHVPPVRIGVGVVVAGVMLSALAQVEPGIAGPLAVLGASSAVFVSGGVDALEPLVRATAGHPSGGSSGRAGGPINT